MKNQGRIAFLLSMILAALVSAGAVIKETKQDEDLSLYVNDGGTVKESVRVEGTDGTTNFFMTGTGASTDALSATVTDGTYTGQVFQMNTTRGASTAFDFLRGVANSVVVTNVSGEGAAQFGSSTVGVSGVPIIGHLQSSTGMQLNRVGGGLVGIELQGAGTKHSRLLASTTHALEVENSSSADAFTVTHTGVMESLLAGSAFKMNNAAFANVRAGIFVSIADSGESCDAECDAGASSHGFAANEAHCVAGAWTRTNTDPLSCAAVDAVSKICLCAGANPS